MSLPGRIRRPLIRIAHAVLSPGRGEVARMTGWCRVILWTYRTPVGRAKALLLPFVTPLRAWRDAAATYAKYGARARTLGAGSRLRQLAQNTWLMSWYGLGGGLEPGSDYYRYQLYLPERRRNARTFVNDLARYEVITWVNHRVAGRATAPLQDKRVFAPWCERHGFPRPTTLLEFRDGRVVGDATAIPDRDLFSKNASGFGGQEGARWFSLGGGRFRDDSGAEYTATEMIEALARRSAKQPLLLQVALRNGPSVADLSPKGALCTVRVNSIRRRGGEPEVLLALLRMPVGDMPVDNWGQGGLAAMIDVRTGRLGPGSFEDIHDVGRTYACHPDTGAVIESRVLPEWGAIADLTLRAHAAIGPVPLIGWDVPITNDGPLLLEGNTDLAQGLPQSNSSVGMERTPYARYINEYVWWAMSEGVTPATAARPLPAGGAAAEAVDDPA